jgi:hypothetical protein
MSVTISIESIPTGAFTAFCYDTDTTLRGDSYEAIVVEIGLHKEVCEDCQHYGLFSQAVVDVDVEDVNMANGNAVLVFAALGIALDGNGGQMSGQDLLGRVLMAQAVGPDDTGIAPAVTGGREVGQPGATMIDCGLRPGYYADRFTQIREIAEVAARLGRNVYWG